MIAGHRDGHPRTVSGGSPALDEWVPSAGQPGDPLLLPRSTNPVESPARPPAAYRLYLWESGNAWMSVQLVHWMGSPLGGQVRS